MCVAKLSNLSHSPCLCGITPLTSHSVPSLHFQHVLFVALNSVTCHRISPGEKAVVAFANATAHVDPL